MRPQRSRQQRRHPASTIAPLRPLATHFESGTTCIAVAPPLLPQTPDRGEKGSAEMLGWLVDERGIEPYVKVFDKSERTDGTFSRSDFA
jgi:hypothetical protein